MGRFLDLLFDKSEELDVGHPGEEVRRCVYSAGIRVGGRKRGRGGRGGGGGRGVRQTQRNPDPVQDTKM